MINVPDALLEYFQTLAFRGNNKLRSAGSSIEYTQEMLDELKKCKRDPIYFIKNYIHIVHPDRGLVKFDLHPYQEKMIKTYHENKRVIFLTARQQGKCLSINTKVRLKQKSTNQIFEITLGDFYAWQKTFEGIDLSMLQQELSRLNSESMFGKL